MNKSQKKAPKPQTNAKPQTKATKKAAKKPLKQSKRNKMTKAQKPLAPSTSKSAVVPFTAPLFQQQRQLSTFPQFKQQKSIFKQPTLSSSILQPQSQQLFSMAPLLGNKLISSASPFNFSKRNLILKPKVGLDPEVDLFMEFNVLKAAEPITEKPDAEYPDWLWTIADPQQSLYDISKIPQDEMNIPTMKRKFKLERRDLIRGNNNSSRK